MITYQKNLRNFRIVSEPTEAPIKRACMQKPADAAEYMYEFFEDIDIYESFYVLLLNQANSTIGYAKISQGGISGTVVDPILVAKYAIDKLAKGVVLAHNHPSGNIQPSEADIRLTKKVAQGLALFDIKVIDHVILSPEKGQFLSLAEEGLL